MSGYASLGQKNQGDIPMVDPIVMGLIVAITIIFVLCK